MRVLATLIVAATFAVAGAAAEFNRAAFAAPPGHSDEPTGAVNPTLEPATRTPPQVDDAPPVEPLAGAFALLEVRVVDDLGVPLPGALVEATASSRSTAYKLETPVRGGTRPFKSRAAFDGTAPLLFDVPAGYELWLDCDAPADNYHRDEWRSVAALEPGERRAVTLTLTKPRGVFRACVRSAVDDAPLTGLPIFVRQRDSWQIAPDGRLEVDELVGQVGATTDADGLFELALEEHGEAEIHLGGGAWSPGHFFLDSKGVDLERPAQIRLQPSAAVAGRILGAPAGVEIQASWPSHATRVHGPRWSSVDHRLTTTCDESGAFELTGLPSGAQLALEVDPEQMPSLLVPDGWTLAAGERRELNVDLDTVASIEVLAVDAEGDPQPDIELSLFSAEALGGTEMVGSHQQPFMTAYTEDDGRAEFLDLLPGTWYVAPPAPDYGQMGVFDEHALAPFATPIVIDGGSALVRATITVHRGLWITGTVTDPSGVPVPNIHLSATRTDEVRFVGLGSSSTDGTYALGPLIPGSYRIATQVVQGHLCAGSPLFADAGTVDLDVPLRAGRSIRVVAHAPDGTTSTQHQLILSQTGSADTTRKTWGRGKATDLGGVPPGTYDLVAATVDGFVGVATGIAVEASEVPLDVAIQLEPGAEVELRYDGPEPHVTASLIHDGVIYDRMTFPSGKVERLVGPAGEIRVTFERWTAEYGAEGRPNKLVHVETAVAKSGEAISVHYRADR